MVQTAQDTWTADWHTAIYDPVPAAAESPVYGSEGRAPHAMEREVQRALLNQTELEFSSLQVHRLADGVCLTGVVRVPRGVKPRIEELASQVDGVQRVLNYLVVQNDQPIRKSR